MTTFAPPRGTGSGLATQKMGSRANVALLSIAVVPGGTGLAPGETLIIFGGGRLLAGPVQAGSSGGNGAVLGGF
jgi:hypothetical protein